MNDVVVVDFLGGKLGTEAQPEAVQQIDFLGRQVRCVRAKVEDFLLPIGGTDLKREMGFGVSEFFPGESGVTRFLGHRHYCGGSKDDC